MSYPARRDPMIDEFRNEMLNLFRMADISDRYERDLLERFDSLVEPSEKPTEDKP
jgi:hypothetical protein